MVVLFLLISKIKKRAWVCSDNKRIRPNLPKQGWRRKFLKCEFKLKSAHKIWDTLETYTFVTKGSFRAKILPFGGIMVRKEMCQIDA